MGYVATPRIFHLVFEDRPGLEVRARSLALGRMLEVLRLLQRGSDVDLDRPFEIFGESLVDWTLETEDHEPIPATVEGLHSIDAGLVKEIMNSWTDAVLGVSGPLEPTSNGGAPSPAVSVPMDPLSPSPSS